MRREFNLPEQDVDYLDISGLNWETISEGNQQWLIIHDFQVPSGYNTDKVTVALNINAAYPVTQIDMVYFFPHLHKISGGSIGALANQGIKGQIWQRWSRHRTGENPWRVGVDDVSTHLRLVHHWLAREIK